jgi:hypothetical protein
MTSYRHYEQIANAADDKRTDAGHLNMLTHTINETIMR